MKQVLMQFQLSAQSLRSQRLCGLLFSSQSSTAEPPSTPRLRREKEVTSLPIKRFLFCLLFICCIVGNALAQEAKPMADDPELEKRVRALSQKLRCPMCQNESLADSPAGVAVDLRNQIREQMKAGKSEEEIMAFLTARYGDFVLYEPPVRPTTYLLWFGPFVFLIVGLFLLYRYVKRRRELIPNANLSPQERALAEQLLKTNAKKEIA